MQDMKEIRTGRITFVEPVPRTPGTYLDAPVFMDGSIYFLQELPLAAVRDCYNLRLHTAPLCLTRQGGEGAFEIVWPEKVCFAMDPHESFFLRDGDRLYFSKWYEEGDDADYRYWEETVVRDLKGDLVEVLSGDLQVMPNGEVWHIGA